jgi:Dehydrogenases with different specificities (related to short-chain alcohol dehydrogenases)
MARIIQEISAERPIRGVVHAAMVFKDGVFEQMDRRNFQAAMDLKVLGTVSLSKALQGFDLDFFVMTSSISATLGNPGQSIYSAANSFFDTLAWQYRLHGRAGVSLVLPTVLDVSVVAE